VTIDIADAGALTVQATGKIYVMNFVTISDGGSVVASMDATFDFADIPPDLHAGVLNSLLRSRIRYMIMTRKEPQPVATPPTPPSSPATAIARTSTKPWWKFW